MVYPYLKKIYEEKGAGFLVLIDPNKEKWKKEKIKRISKQADAILVGGSTANSEQFNEFVKKVKENSGPKAHQPLAEKVPVIIFPGSSVQVSRYADAIFFTSLVSGRNPDYLIGEQVKAAPIIKKFNIETIPVGYILVESGSLTSVLYTSNTFPIPRDKYNIARDTALASEYLGMKFVYFDAGSGAKLSVPSDLIKEVKNYISIPIIVGGGIRTPEEAEEKIKAGADFVVIGNKVEEDPECIKAFGEAIHKNG